MVAVWTELRDHERLLDTVFQSIFTGRVATKIALAISRPARQAQHHLCARLSLLRIGSALLAVCQYASRSEQQSRSEAARPPRCSHRHSRGWRERHLVRQPAARLEIHQRRNPEAQGHHRWKNTYHCERRPVPARLEPADGLRVGRVLPFALVRRFRQISWRPRFPEGKRPDSDCAIY